MQRRLTKGGKNDKKQVMKEDSDFSDDDFSLDFQQQDYGKRTGKVFNPKNWKKNSDGFYDIPLEQDDDSQTPRTRIAKLKQFLGLHIQEEQSNMNKRSYEEDSSPQEQKREVSRKNNNRKSRQSFAQKRKSRKSDQSFSFSLDLDADLGDELMEASFSSEETDLEQDLRKINKSNKKNKEKQSLQQQQEPLLKVEKQKQKSKRVSFNVRQAKETKQQPRQQQKKEKKSSQKKPIQNKPQQNRQIKRQSTKIQKKSIVTEQENISKARSPFEKKSPKIQVTQIQKQSLKIESNITSNQSINKNFKDISEIKMNQKSNDYSFDNELFGSLLGQMENQPSISQTGGQLNKAVINTQTQNDDQKEAGQKDLQQNKKVKIFQKQSKNVVRKSQTESEVQNKKSIERNQQEKKNPEKSKKSKQTFFLTQSLRKEALYYYEQERKEEQEKRKKEELKKKKKQGKRQRQFESIQTDDILNEQKLDEMKIKAETKKAMKKVKVDQTLKPQKLEKSQKNLTQKTQNVPKIKENIKEQKKSPKNPEKRLRKQVNQELQQSSYQQQSGQFYPQQQQEKIKVNNRLVKDVDRALKRKQKPERVSPVQKKGIKKAQSMSVGRKISKSRGDKGSRKKTEVEQLMGNRKNSIIEDSMIESGRKYPKRKRFAPVQSWNGEKIVYNANGQATVESKQLIRLIGLINENTGPLNENSLDSEITLVRKDRFIQKILLMPRQIVEFEGFDDKYQELHITYIRKSKGNYQKAKKSVQVFQDGDMSYLIQPRIIQANSGGFTIQNVSEESAYLQLVLFKNQQYQI